MKTLALIFQALLYILVAGCSTTLDVANAIHNDAINAPMAIAGTFLLVLVYVLLYMGIKELIIHIKTR